MLAEVFPRSFRRYLALPILGVLADDFARWLHQQGYRKRTIRTHVRRLPDLEKELCSRGTTDLQSLTREVIHAGYPVHSQGHRRMAAALRALERFLESRSLLPVPAATPSNSELLAGAYATYLEQTRAFAPGSIHHHRARVLLFLRHIDYEANPSRLTEVSSPDIERFLTVLAQSNARASMQHVVANLRGFFRFLAVQGVIKPGLDTQIDTPRVYRLEQLPRALPWETVLALLRSIDQSTPLGGRDYTMLFLCATYGLRASEIVALTLEDVDWRRGLLRVRQRKTASTLWLPLTDEAGAVLCRYLQTARPASVRRELFLRARAPEGVLKPTAVTEVFQAWSQRSGLSISFQGPHCLRHSLAVHLLREGASIPAIGELLGHRCAESTTVYLRLALEDLREVALPVPEFGNNSSEQEGRP